MKYEESELVELKSILNEDAKTNDKPTVLTSLCMFKVTFPNLNYGFDEGHNVSQNVPQKSDEQLIIELIKINPKITRK